MVAMVVVVVVVVVVLVACGERGCVVMGALVGPSKNFLRGGRLPLFWINLNTGNCCGTL